MSWPFAGYLFFLTGYFCILLFWFGAMSRTISLTPIQFLSTLAKTGRCLTQRRCCPHRSTQDRLDRLDRQHFSTLAGRRLRSPTSLSQSSWAHINVTKYNLTFNRRVSTNDLRADYSSYHQALFSRERLFYLEARKDGVHLEPCGVRLEAANDGH